MIDFTKVLNFIMNGGWLISIILLIAIFIFIKMIYLPFKMIYIIFPLRLIYFIFLLKLED